MAENDHQLKICIVVEVSLLFARWRHYFPKLIYINYGTMYRMNSL